MNVLQFVAIAEDVAEPFDVHFVPYFEAFRLHVHQNDVVPVLNDVVVVVVMDVVGTFVAFAFDSFVAAVVVVPFAYVAAEPVLFVVAMVVVVVVPILVPYYFRSVPDCTYPDSFP